MKIKINYPKNRYTGPKPWMDKDWLENEYVTKDRSTQDIADEYGCVRNTIQQWLAKYKIKKPVVKQYTKYDYLYQNYVVLGKTIGEIAQSNSVHVETIRYQLEKYGIEIRPQLNGNLKYEKYADEIIDKYCNQRMSAYEISKQYNTSHSVIIKLLKRHGIETRNMQEAQFNYHGKDIPEAFSNPEKLDVMHNGLNVSCKDIGKLLGVEGGTVRRQMKRLGLHTNNDAESKIGLMCGDKHPNWQGGITPLYALLREYCHTNIRPKVLQRDNYTCQICGCKNRELHAHHIYSFEDIVRDICAENPWLNEEDVTDKQALYHIIVNDPRFTDENNMVTLCDRCHFDIHTGKIISSQAQKYIWEGSETIPSGSTSEAIADGSARGLSDQSVI